MTTAAHDTSQTPAAPGATRSPRPIWHYTPALPLTQAPYFEWPLDVGASLKYLFHLWRPFSPRFLMLLVAIALWNWFTPSLERTQNFEWQWVFEIGLRNLVLVLLVAGGLHLFLFTYRRQGDATRYDARPLATRSKVFYFGDQVWDNIFWTLCGAVPFATLWESLLLWGYANGYVTLITFGEAPLWFIGVMLFVPIWSGFHFYWYHRLLHVPPLYKWIHSWHHKNVNTGPWSGHAMHPLEHLMLYSDVAIYFVVASHPVHLIFNLMLHTIAGPTSHCGYHEVRLTMTMKKHIRLQLGDFMHQLHHRFIDCNYGSYETPWDKIFGSFHDGTHDGDRAINERRRRMYARRAQRATGRKA